MKRERRSALLLTLLWLLIVPPGVVAILWNNPPGQVNGLYIALFSLAGFFSVLFPIITNFYDHSRKLNRDLQRAVQVGGRLSALLTEEKVIDQFMVETSGFFKTDYAYLFDHQDGWLELIRSYEQGRFVDNNFANMAAGRGIAGMVLEWKQPVNYHKRNKWETLSKGYSPDDMQSVICVPISRNQKIETVVLLASKKKFAFKHYQLKILDILCTYFTVNVEKARYMEEAMTKSERCALTKLYNYRHLDACLEQEVSRLRTGEISKLSVIILDIDHFKSINDTYGHQSGNDLLIALAAILQTYVFPGTTVARYGGEEFVFVLPDIGAMDAVDMAEMLRREVASTTFRIVSDLSETREPLDIRMTISLGVATVSEDVEDAKGLLRNADRALYMGGKRAGRNRVGVYGYEQMRQV
ncbi:GGDEF domain-containing protein [Sporosarcina sp. ACRSM]|uniref:GGDEF domain-containing protein n=1 Tax=Sporosarcina sp. ACRSM TaxID=2918216 RepID=UPI001EF66E4E|nr:GGDEF domain-containing protein [Sporosarcina sp. ACRSM]MCG7336992.1 GGDEF domain-containing protein [Sporosarcina sp. ACRSM]